MRKLLLILISTFLTQCSCAFDTTEAQASRSISESKKNGFYLKQLIVSNRLDDINIEEAWIEKVWYYDYKGNQVIKTSVNMYQLVFKIKQTPNSKFLLNDVLSWTMIQDSTKNYVGVKIWKKYNKITGVYYLSSNNIESINPIIINLFLGAGNDKIKVGNIIFHAKT